LPCINSQNFVKRIFFFVFYSLSTSLVNLVRGAQVVKLDSGRRLLMKAAGVSKVRALASALERNAAQVARARSGVSGATGATL